MLIRRVLRADLKCGAGPDFAVGGQNGVYAVVHAMLLSTPRRRRGSSPLVLPLAVTRRVARRPPPLRRAAAAAFNGALGAAVLLRSLRRLRLRQARRVTVKEALQRLHGDLAVAVAARAGRGEWLGWARGILVRAWVDVSGPSLHREPSPGKSFTRARAFHIAARSRERSRARRSAAHLSSRRMSAAAAASVRTPPVSALSAPNSSASLIVPSLSASAAASLAGREMDLRKEG